MSFRTTTEFKTAAQDVFRELWQDGKKIESSVIRKGGLVEIVEGSGYHTEVHSKRLRSDVSATENASGIYTEEQVEDARERLERASADEGDEEKVYGPLFEPPA
jgi:hypothetical protein